MMPAFIIIGSTIIPAIWPRCCVEHALQRREVVERDDAQQVGHRLRDAGAGHAVRCRRSGPSWSARAEDRDHRRVVVTVVGALDLHDQRHDR